MRDESCKQVSNNRWLQRLVARLVEQRTAQSVIPARVQTLKQMHFITAFISIRSSNHTEQCCDDYIGRMPIREHHVVLLSLLPIVAKT